MSPEPPESPADRPADPEQIREGFAEGQEDRVAHPEDDDVGRFSEGQEDLPDDPEKAHHGRFSEGQEELGEDDPEKHEEGRFSTGQDHEPPGIVP